MNVFIRGLGLVAARAAQLYGRDAQGRPVIGWTRRGAPIYPIAGGASYDDVIDRTTNADTRSVGPIDMPDTVAREVIKAMPEQSAALTLMRRATMSSRTQRQPVMSLLPVAYWVGGDTGLKQTTAAQWKNKYLVAEELATIVPVPDAVLDDEAFPIWDEVRPYLVEAAGALIDAATLFGTGKPASWTDDAIVVGAADAGNEVVRAAADQDLASDLNDAAALVATSGFSPNGYALDALLRYQVQDLRNDQGTPIFSQTLAGGSSVPSLYGLNAAFINNGAFDLDAAEAIVGDWGKAIIGIRRDITITTHTEGVISDDDGKVILNLMQQDSAAIRLVMRLGFAVANPVTRRQPTEGDRYPFAVLRPTGFTGS